MTAFTCLELIKRCFLFCRSLGIFHFFALTDDSSRSYLRCRVSEVVSDEVIQGQGSEPCPCKYNACEQVQNVSIMTV